jgi:hypothetical protein
MFQILVLNPTLDWKIVFRMSECKRMVSSGPLTLYNMRGSMKVMSHFFSQNVVAINNKEIYMDDSYSLTHSLCGTTALTGASRR